MYAAKAVQWKRDAVTEISETLARSGTIALVDVADVPADLFMDMRAELRRASDLRVVKKAFIRLAWEKVGLDGDVLEGWLAGTEAPALVTSNQVDSFRLFKQLQATRTGRAPKGGDIAPFDIEVAAGDTAFPPGPIVGELSSVGIPARIQKGSVHITKKAIPVREGEVVSGDLALMLDKLGIHPIEIGLILKGTLENGTVFTPDVLDIDEDAFMATLGGAITSAFNVACTVAWTTAETMPTLVSLAASQAMALGVSSGIVDRETLPLLIGRAHGQMLAVAGQLDSSALGDDLASALGAAAAAVASAAPAAVAEAEEAESEEPEDDEPEFGGLGDLFG